MSDGLELDAEGHLSGSNSAPVKRGTIALKLKTSSTNADSQPHVQIASASKKRKHKAKSENGYGCLADGAELIWDQKVLLLGDKIEQPNLHICEHCSLPILIYGRLKRCKHSFCLLCTLNSQGKCPRCGEASQEHERGELGSVHICSYGGSRHGHSGCRRSYLSQRDLQAHIRYRHEGGQEKASALQQQQAQQQQQQQQAASGLRPPLFPPALVPPPPPGPRLPGFPLSLPPDLPPGGGPPFFAPGVKPHFPPGMEATAGLFPGHARPTLPPPPPQAPAVSRPPPPGLAFAPQTVAVSRALRPGPSPSGPTAFVAFEARTSYP